MKINKHEKIKVIWRLIDGKAGHDKQSLALIESLKNQTKCRVFDINVKSQRIPILNIIFKNYKLPEGTTKPDIAIGAGHKTHFHLLAIKRCFDSKILVIMRPSLPLKFFDLCVIPKHDEVRSCSNVFITSTPLVSFNLYMEQKENKALFLIGGPSKHYYWDPKMVLDQIKNIIKKYKFKKLLLLTSRRTPLNFINEFNKSKIRDLTLFEHSKIKKNWLHNNIMKVKNIWVTNDSYSMLIEAIASGAKTDILELKVKKKSKLSKEINTIKRQLKNKMTIQNEAYRVARFIQTIWF